MKKLFIIASLFLVSLTAFTAINAIWKNDPPHSQLGFTVTHLGISDVSGTFNDFNVTIDASKEDFSDASIALEAQIASIDTRVEQRNNHLKSADFFDAEQFPTIKYQSTGIKKAGKNKYKLTGDLTIHGVTKPVEMELEYRGTTENPMSKKQTAGFKLSGTINRLDFGVGKDFPEAVVSNEVRIEADGEFVQ